MRQFAQRWSKAEHLSAQLGIALGTVSIVAISLCVALIYVAFKPRPIYFIPGVTEGGMALPQVIPPSSVANFLSAWVLNWSNFTPATVVDVYERALKFMSPRLLAQTQARLDKDIQEVKQNNISSFYSLFKEPVVEVEKAGFLVTLEGQKGVYMGKEEIKTQRIIYKVRVRRINPTQNNPYGLMIDDIDQDVMP